MRKRYALLFGVMLALAAVACNTIRLFAESTGTPGAVMTTEAGDVTQSPPTFPPPPTPTPLAGAPVLPGAANPDEPVIVSGEIEVTNSIFRSLATEPYVVLTDSSGYATRTYDQDIPPQTQVLGFVEPKGETGFAYSLVLPGVPQGALVDVDNDGESDAGVQVFTIDFGWNTWGGPFLDDREIAGWGGGSFSSVLGDPENNYEWNSGTLIVWSPNDAQMFPIGYGDDKLLFTEDDPAGPISPGYNFVDINEEPFRFYKAPQEEIPLEEGSIAVNDLSDLSYEEAFDAFFEKASREYPFTEEKNVDWDALYDEYSPQIAGASSDEEFYVAFRDFVYSIPDGHIGGLFNANAFFGASGGGFGMVLRELGDGRVLVTQVLPDTPAAEAGIEEGAEIIEWNGVPISDAIAEVNPNVLSSFSTEHTRHLGQIIYLMRVPDGTEVDVQFQNPGASPDEVTITAIIETNSLIIALLGEEQELNLPVEGKIVSAGLGYIKVSSFADETHLAAAIFDRYMHQMIDNEIPGLIIDLRVNGGGTGIASQFAGYFFDEEFEGSRRSYFSDATGQFEYSLYPSTIDPAEIQYDAPVAVLIGPDCVSACEGLSYLLSLSENVTLIGHSPTAGAYGEVGQGQYELPGDLQVQIPTGRSETLEGDLLIEGTGVEPDITIPVSEEEVLGDADPVLDAAVEMLLNLLGQ